MALRIVLLVISLALRRRMPGALPVIYSLLHVASVHQILLKVLVLPPQLIVQVTHLEELALDLNDRVEDLWMRGLALLS